MSKIENLAAVLCDELMVDASNGNMENIRETVVMLVEYASCEVARHGNTEAATALENVARRFEENFPASPTGYSSKALPSGC